MTSGGNGNVIAAPTSQRPPSTITSQGNHSLSCARSVIACQTTAGGSGRYRSSRTAGRAAVESAGPQRAGGGEPHVDLRERLRANAVQAALRVDARLDQARVLEHAQVLRHQGLAHPEALHELAG